MLLACNSSPFLSLESSLTEFAKVSIRCNKDRFYLTRSHNPQTLHLVNTQHKHVVTLKNRRVLLNRSKRKFIRSELLNWDSVYKSHSLLYNSNQSCPPGHFEWQKQAYDFYNFQRSLFFQVTWAGTYYLDTQICLKSGLYIYKQKSSGHGLGRQALGGPAWAGSWTGWPADAPFKLNHPVLLH